jgi:hypothetical protein
MEAAYGIRAFSALSVLIALAATLVGVSSVLAQTPPASSPAPAPGATGPLGVGVVAPSSPPPEFGFERSIPDGQDGAREEEFYPPERTRSIHQPAFLRGAAGTIRTSRTSGVRVGLSGWTAPRVPFDSQRESSGGAAFGLTIEWGTPLEPPVEPALPSQR